MGVLGLRKFIDGSSCTKFLPAATHAEEEVEEEPVDGDETRRERRHAAMLDADADENPAASSSPSAFGSSDAVTPRVDHVLVDLNCIIHSCFDRDAAVVTKRDIIEAVLQRLRVLLTRVVSPSLSLTICIDGPAPYAKLHTQRLRRRRLAMLDTCGAQQLTSLAITPGSLFLVELENALAAQFKLCGGRGFLQHYVPVFLHGSTVVGEGEAKIARALAHIATASLSRSCSHYNPNHTVALIGNDIDLTLTCMGTTQYHNLFVLGPSSMQLISISELLYRWLQNSLQPGATEFRLTAQELASVRVDFVFLFLLNGGDHYAGAGEVAHVLWKRYRTVRAASQMQRSLVAPDLRSIDVEFLVDILQADDYVGDAEVAVGMQLLHAALWSLQTTVTGVCPDYQYVPAPASPHLNHARAAAAHCHKKGQRISFPPHSNKKKNNSSSRRSDPTLPLTPLETFVALMPSEAALPVSVAEALRSSRKHEQVVHVLLSSNDAAAVAAAAQQAVGISDAHLTVSERYLRDFTTPVQLNVLQPPKRLSRYEQHRMLATQGRIVRGEPMPLVERITLPESLDYVDVPYPSHVKDLIFVSPFDRAAEISSSGNFSRNNANGDHHSSGGVTDDPRHCRTAAYSKGSSNVSAAADDHNDDSGVVVVKTNNKYGGGVARRCGGRQRHKSNLRRIPVFVGPVEAEPSAAQQLQQTLYKASALRMPEGRDKKTLRRLKKRLNAHLQLDAKQTRNGEGRDEESCHLLRRNDKAFLAEIQQFLGEDGGSVTSLLHDDSNGAQRANQQSGHQKKQGHNAQRKASPPRRKRSREEEEEETTTPAASARGMDGHGGSLNGTSRNKRQRRGVTRRSGEAAATRKCDGEGCITANGQVKKAKRRRKC